MYISPRHSPRAMGIRFHLKSLAISAGCFLACIEPVMPTFASADGCPEVTYHRPTTRSVAHTALFPAEQSPRF